MSGQNANKSVLSKSNSVDILIYLLVNGESKATIIQNGINLNYDSLKNSASRLEENGLITSHEVCGKSRYIAYKLTPMGEDVAADLKRANDRINGILPDDPEMNCGSPSEEGDTVRE